MSGARLVLHLALELKRRGGGVGAAALCGGGGQGDALIVQVPRLRAERPSAVGADAAVVPTSSSGLARATRARWPG